MIDHEATPLTFKKWKIGDVTVTRVLEMDQLTLTPEYLLKTDAATVKKHPWLQPTYANAEGQLILHIQAFIVETSGLKIMVDPCIGNDKPRKSAYFAMHKGPFLEHLKLAGFPPESIDVVLCTHLHVDHVGWNTILVDGKWVPTFPNARYLFARVEFEYAKVATSEEGESEAVYLDSIKPVLDAGLVDLVEVDYRITDEVWLEPTPGHTPGHCCIHISSKGQEAIITGDMMHHPVQACEPDVCSTFCENEELTRSTRKEFLRKYGDKPTIVLGTHFAGPTGVHVKRDGEVWRMEDA
ncbi:MBL fold metallo-hydrolase [Paraburkholderia youngii]|uniref:Glyoxylase-like metal-dependent hydrolase (Beta-lactamase superfamily II) n=1 Tax=Paraburkholderia youngii TaxID=2782701 RepID=A0A7W8P7E0_9BURK|nr:MBL fold metallo-hydrolase [Paraburkholderia youngii]MBB5404458.1 glyoxylase-like metal-dependent hydrolase (beta-lactamase superfamily II) [Paraburkholderia youngii]